MRPPRQAVDHHAPAGSTVTSENVTDVLRELDEAPPTAATAPLRDGVARYEAARGTDALNAGDFEGALHAMRWALMHYPPEDVQRGGLPRELSTLARGVLDTASARGDEAHALAAARLLQAVAPADPVWAAQFQAIRQWGESNRQAFHAPWVFRAEMAEIYREAARITPASDLIQHAADDLIGRLEEVGRAASTRSNADGHHLSFEDMQSLRTARDEVPAQLAILYLRVGDIAGAAAAIGRAQSPAYERLTSGLQRIATGEGGADGLFELAGQLQSLQDPAALAAICRRGRVLYPTDPRFSPCLAQSAATEGQFGLASAHLEAAVQLTPTDPHLLELLLRTAREWLASEVGNDDAGGAHRALARAEAALALWTQRFPTQHPPVTQSELDELGARIDLGQANLAAAETHLERAMHASPPSREAFLTRAEIAWRRHDTQRALQVLEQGVALPVQPSESDSMFRPLFQLRIGLAKRAAHDEAGARTSLEQAASGFEALTRALDGPQSAEAYYALAEADEALGRSDATRRALDAALAAASDSRELAGRAIVFSLGRGRWHEALEFARAARGRLQLDRSWQVYFALWDLIAAHNAGIAHETNAENALDDLLHTSADDRATWTTHLAQRYRGTITRDQLAHFATNVGQRAEAAFYEAMLSFGTGDLAGAQRDLQACVASDMTRFLEYEMAWEMLSRGLPALASSAPATTSAAPTVTLPSAPVSASSAPAVVPRVPARRPRR